VDPASAAVALLAPYLAKAAGAFATKAGEAALEGTKSLLAAIRRKFSHDGDDYAAQTLQRLEERPDDKGRQSGLESVLAEKAHEDPSFAEELKKLVEASTAGQPVTNFLTQVYGGEVGKIVNIGEAGTVNIS